MLSDEPRTLLLVEDDADIRDAMAMVLERCGYRVLTAVDGEQAFVRLAGREPPSLIVLDWMMPVMSGPEVIARLGCDPLLSRVPVLVVSAIDRAGSLSSAQIACVLQKPVRMRTLVDVVDRLCGLPRRAPGVVTGAFAAVTPAQLAEVPLADRTVRIKRPTKT